MTSNWSGTAPQNHPSHAPEAVGFKIADNSAVYYIDSTDNGGFLDLTFSLYSWKPTPSMIYIESTVLDVVEWLDPDDILIGDGDNYKTYHVEIPVDKVTGIQGQELWVIAEYEDFDYDNNYKSFPNRAMGDPLIAAFRRGLTVLDYNPMWMMVVSPNGGEEFACGSSNVIEWVSYCVPGNVNIEYSTDDFVSDFHDITINEENDGTYTWYPVPCDISDTVKIRITSTQFQFVNDVSDDYFRIFDDGTNFGWVQTWGGVCPDASISVAVDSDGNAYVTGYFQCNFDFNPEGGDWHATNGSSDVFLCKYDTFGNFEWVRTWGGSDIDCGMAVVVDGFMDVYVTGYFYETVDFDPGIETDTHTSINYNDVFLSKFDPDGEFLWARTWGGYGYDYPTDIATTDDGVTFITGVFNYTVDFDPDSSDLHTSMGYTDVFLSSFTATGKANWAHTWGGWYRDYSGGVAIDGTGDIYVTGTFYTSVDFNPGSGTDIHTSTSWCDVFVSKFDIAGNFLWARTWGSGTSPERGTSVAADSNGNVYTSCDSWGACDFDPGPSEFIIPWQGSRVVCLSKLDSDGIFQWAGFWSADRIRGLALDGSDYIYVAGSFLGTVDFDPGTGTDNHMSHGQEDVCLSKLDSSGDFVWARTWGGYYMDRGYGVATDSLGKIISVGLFYGVTDFAPTEPPCNNPPFERYSNGSADAFLTKHLSTGCW